MIWGNAHNEMLGENRIQKNHLHLGSNSIYVSIALSSQLNKNIESEWRAESDLNFLFFTPFQVFPGSTLLFLYLWKATSKYLLSVFSVIITYFFFYHVAISTLRKEDNAWTFISVAFTDRFVVMSWTRWQGETPACRTMASMSFADEGGDRNSPCILVAHPSFSASSLTVRSGIRPDKVLRLDTVFWKDLWISFCKPEI